MPLQQKLSILVAFKKLVLNIFRNDKKKYVTNPGRLGLKPLIITLLGRFENFEPGFTNFLAQISITGHHIIVPFLLKVPNLYFMTWVHNKPLWAPKPFERGARATELYHYYIPGFEQLTWDKSYQKQSIRNITHEPEYATLQLNR